MPKDDKRRPLSQRDMAGILGVDTKTLYNWRKNKPRLYRIMLLGFEFERIIDEVDATHERIHSIESEIEKRIRE